MKKTVRIIACILAALLLVFGGIAVWQRQNIRALLIGLQTDSAALQSQLTSEREALQKEVEEITDSTVRELTEEETAAIASGDLSPEEAAALIVKPQEKTPAESSEEKPTEASITAPYIAELYAYKAYYLGAINGVIADLKKEYSALPAEQRTGAKKRSMAMAKVNEIASLEESCDAKVANIIKSIHADLKAAGLPDTVSQKVQDAYNNEKNTQKAYFLSLYNG